METWELLNLELFWGNRVVDVLLFVAILIGAGIVALVLAKLMTRAKFRRAAGNSTRRQDLLIELLIRPVQRAVVLIGAYVAFLSLDLGTAGSVVRKVIIALVTVVVTVFFIRFVDRFFWEYAQKLAVRTESKLDDQLLPILRKVAKLVIWIIAGLIVVSNLGYDISSLLAGMGIAGLAVGMASKDLVANMFGSVAILADHPFEVGDVITVGGLTGTIEEVGLRSTRMRSLEGTEIIVPNSRFIDSSVENVTRRPRRKVTQTLGLVYATAPEQLKRLPELIRSIILGTQGTLKEEVYVLLAAFGESSLDVQISYWTETDIERHMQTRHCVNVQIKEALDHAGYVFAFKMLTLDPQPLQIRQV